MDRRTAPEQRVSLFRRGFWKKNLASTVQVAIMCHARKRAPLYSAIVGEQAQLPCVGTDAFGQSVLDVVAQRTLKASLGLMGSQKNETRWPGLTRPLS